MINYRVERVIFIVLFIVLFLATGLITTNIKKNALDINKGKTPEEVIEEAFPELKAKGLQYRFEIVDDFLFVYMETVTGHCNFDFAYKTKNSNYYFKIPGFSFFSERYNFKQGVIELSENELLYYYIYQIDSKYIIEIADLFGKRDIKIYLNEKEIDNKELENVLNQYWTIVFTDLNQSIEITCVYEGDETLVIDSKKIKSLYGVK